MSKAKKPRRRLLGSKPAHYTKTQQREARAIVAIAALQIGKYSMSYYRLADTLGFDKKSADAANSFWMDANGATDWSPKTEEKTLVHICRLLDMDV